MPKIAHVITTFYATNTSGWVSALAAGQKERGWPVELIVGRNATPELLQQKEREGFAVTQVGSLRKYIHPWLDLQALWDLTRIFKEKKIDIVHTHLAKAGVVGRLAAGMAGIKTVIHSVYGATFAPTLPWAKNLLFTKLEKLAGCATDQFIFVGQELREAYVQAGVLPSHKGQVIYYGKDLSSFMEAVSLTTEADRQALRQSLGIDPQAVILGNVSRIVPWKGHLYALEALHGLKKSAHNVKLIIVGDGKVPSEIAFKKKLMDRAKFLGLDKEVIFTGWQKEPAKYYSIFDIYVITSMPFEGVPGSVIEAVVSDLPVVGFDCYGVREIPGIKASLVPPKDVAGLVRALEEEIAQLPEIRGYGKKPMGIQALTDRFSMARMVADTCKLYEKLIADICDQENAINNICRV